MEHLFCCQIYVPDESGVQFHPVSFPSCDLFSYLFSEVNVSTDFRKERGKKFLTVQFNNVLFVLLSFRLI